MFKNIIIKILKTLFKIIKVITVVPYQVYMSQFNGDMEDLLK